MLWNYLRAKVRESILAGVADALVEVEGDGDTAAHTDLASLVRERLHATPALPAPAGAAAETKAVGRRRVAS